LPSDGREDVQMTLASGFDDDPYTGPAIAVSLASLLALSTRLGTDRAAAMPGRVIGTTIFKRARS